MYSPSISFLTNPVSVNFYLTNKSSPRDKMTEMYAFREVIDFDPRVAIKIFSQKMTLNEFLFSFIFPAISVVIVELLHLELQHIYSIQKLTVSFVVSKLVLRITSVTTKLIRSERTWLKKKFYRLTPGNARTKT